jgi:murein DD-endopeptidase MepM/ murein hydrolase activator NlpD
MAIKRPFAYSRVALRLLAASGVAAFASGCSDASRFASDPFSDPFAGSTKTAAAGVDHAPVGAIASAPSNAVESRPLPASGASASANRASSPAASQSPARIATPSGGGHWSAEGGTPIVVAQGETAGMIATRYGVPPDALLRANGFNVAAQVQPGSRLVIPVYRAGGPAVAAHAPADPAKAASATAQTPKSVTAKAGAAAKSVHKTEVEPPRGKLADSKASAKSAHEKTLAMTEPNGAAATPARVVKPERIARGAQASPAANAESAETANARKVDSTATASIPPANESKAIASDDGRPEFRWPARGRIIQGFSTGGNDGINIAVPEGTQVKAVEGGVVAYAGNELKGYGNLVLIRHPNGFVSAYAHNGALDVKRGDQVKRGQTIAKSGQSGNVGSPQLHFELRKGSTPVDPTRYLAGL